MTSQRGSEFFMWAGAFYALGAVWTYSKFNASGVVPPSITAILLWPQTLWTTQFATGGVDPITPGSAPPEANAGAGQDAPPIDTTIPLILNGQVQ